MPEAVTASNRSGPCRSGSTVTFLSSTSACCRPQANAAASIPLSSSHAHHLFMAFTPPSAGSLASPCFLAEPRQVRRPEGLGRDQAGGDVRLLVRRDLVALMIAAHCQEKSGLPIEG